MRIYGRHALTSTFQVGITACRFSSMMIGCFDNTDLDGVSVSSRMLICIGRSNRSFESPPSSSGAISGTREVGDAHLTFLLGWS